MKTYYLLFICSLTLFTHTPTLAKNDKAKEAIQKAMDEQVVCWNKGDIECFMKGYWQSDSLKFLGSNGLNYGWQKTLEKYQKTYHNKDLMGILQFEIILMQPIEKGHYLVTGKWHIQREAEELMGYYTLVWEEIGGKWVIIYDHSSGTCP